MIAFMYGKLCNQNDSYCNQNDNYCNSGDLPPTPQLPHSFSLLFRRAQKIPVIKGVNSLIQNLRKLDQHIRN